MEEYVIKKYKTRGEQLMKYGFLFGAGAEVGYNLPLGSKFALDIFRYDNTASKERFKEMRDAVDPITSYAENWLPDEYNKKNISAFGKKVFQNIIKDTIEHNRKNIIKKLNDFDSLAKRHAEDLKNEGIDIVNDFESLLNKKINNIGLSRKIKYINEFQTGNDLFRSHFFSALLLAYKKKGFWESTKNRKEFGNMILSILQLQLGALSEDLTKRINEGVFVDKDDEIDLFDDLGDIIQLNYSEAGLIGMEYLLDMQKPEVSKKEDELIIFLQLIIEDVYASVLDYKSLIDSNWYYLYNPRYEWAKFTKICVFLLTVRNYIKSKGDNKCNNPNGYYDLLKKAIDDRLFDVTEIATTNYNTFIEEIVKEKVTYLNGSTDMWYDPYINKIGKKDEVLDSENHIIIPLMFTQSGTKPMTSISMSEKYVNTYNNWKNADYLVVVGFGFGSDDEHINGIIRTLIDDDNHKIVVVDIKNELQNEDEKIEEIGKRLKIRNTQNVHMILVDKNGIEQKTKKVWTEYLAESFG